MPIDKFVAALEADGWTVTWQPYGQPYVLDIQRGDETHRLRVYIWNVTPGGPSGVRPEGEFRIQKMVEGPLTIDDIAYTLLVGWYAEGQVFVSWNPLVHKDAAYSTSIQVPQKRLEEAGQRGIAVHPRENPPEVVIVFAPEAVSYVLHGLENLPLATDDPGVVEVIGEASSKAGVPPADLAGMPDEHQQVATKVTKWSRDASFRARVLWAYERRCAFCCIQLGIVHAAHILPVPQTGSTDETSNGICLCPTCHSAFDGNLIGMLEDGSIVVNRDKVNRLKAMALEGGLTDWMKRLNEKAIVPKEEALRPGPQFVKGRLAAFPGQWVGVHQYS